MDYGKIKKISLVIYLTAGLLLIIEFFFSRFFDFIFRGHDIFIYSISFSAMIFVEILKYLTKRNG